MFALFVERFRAKLNERLQQKTGWGRNEAVSLVDEVLVEVLAEVMDSAHIPAPPHNPQNPLNPLPGNPMPEFWKPWCGRTEECSGE